jgi:O-antigen ligase
MQTPLPSSPRPSRRRTVVPITLRRACYDWGVIGLLMMPATVGVILFGAVRNWSAGALMVVAFLSLAFFFLRPFFCRELLTVRLPPGGMLMALMALYCAILIPFSSVPYETKVEALKWASYVGAYWAWTELSSRHGRWRILLLIPLLIGVGVALYALVLHMQGSTAVLNMERPEGYGMRASGTFRAPAHMGAYMGTMVCLALCLMMMPAAGVMLRFLAGYGFLMFVPVLILTGSRSAWVGTMVGVPIILLLMMWRKSRRAFWVTFVLLPVVGSTLLAALWFGSPMIRERVGEAVRVEGTAAWRLVAWRDSWEMAKAEPLIGWGPGTYRWMYSPYQSWSGDRWLRYAHNEYMHLLVEYGWLGVGLMGCFMFLLIGRSVLFYVRADSLRDAQLVAGFLGVLFAALGHAMFDFNLHVFSLVHLLVLIAGVTMGSRYRVEDIKTRTLPLWCFGGLSLGAAVLAVLAFQVTVSGAFVRFAEDKIEEIDLLQANPYAEIESDLRAAMRVNQADWLAYLEMGNLTRRRAHFFRDVEYREEKYREALDHYHEAYSRNPYDMNVVYGIGRTWYMLGDGEKSLEYLNRATAHAPNNVFYHRELGRQLREMERYEEALAAFTQAHRAGGWDDPVVQRNLRWLRAQTQSR